MALEVSTLAKSQPVKSRLSIQHLQIKEPGVGWGGVGCGGWGGGGGGGGGQSLIVRGGNLSHPHGWA